MTPTQEPDTDIGGMRLPGVWHLGETTHTRTIRTMARQHTNHGTVAEYPKQQRNRILRTWVAVGAAAGAAAAAALVAKGTNLSVGVLVAAAGAVGGAAVGAKLSENWQAGIRAEHHIRRLLEAHSRRHMRRAQTWWGWRQQHGGDVDAIYAIQDTSGKWRVAVIEIKAGNGPVRVRPDRRVEVGHRTRKVIGGDPVGQADDGRRRVEGALRRAARKPREEIQVGAVVAVAWGSGAAETAAGRSGRRVIVAGADRLGDAIVEALRESTPLDGDLLEAALTAQYQQSYQKSPITWDSDAFG